MSEIDGLPVGPELDRDVTKFPAEKRLKMENSNEEDPGMPSADASTIMCMKSEMSKTLSKRQLKKQKKKEKWQAYRPVKR